MSIKFDLLNGTLPPGVDLSETGRLSGYIGDVTEDETYDFTVRATNIRNQLYADRSFSIIGLNDPLRWVTSPGAIFVDDMYEGNTVNFQFQATNPENLVLVYSIIGGTIPPGLALSPTGKLVGTIDVIPNDTTYNFTIRVSDGNNYSDRSFSIHVINQELGWVTNAGQLFTEQETETVGFQFNALGGDENNTNFALVAGSLPPGLSMDSNGLISGVLYPLSETTDYTFTVRLQDGVSIQDRTFTITAIDLPPLWQTGGIIDTTTGITENLQFNATNRIGTSTVYSVVGGELPPLLSLSPSGLLTGSTGTTARPYFFTVRADDSTSISDRAFTYNVLGQIIWDAPFNAGGNLQTSYEGSSVNIQLSSNSQYNGATVTYSIVAGSLPTGITLNNSGLISGIMPLVNADNTYNFTVRAEDGYVTSEKAFSLTSRAYVGTMNSNQSFSFDSGDSVNQVLSYSTNDPTASISIISGSLPSGLTLTSNGRITGTAPTVNSTSNYTIGIRLSGTYISNIDTSVNITIESTAGMTLIAGSYAGFIGYFHEDGQSAGSLTPNIYNSEIITSLNTIDISGSIWMQLEISGYAISQTGWFNTMEIFNSSNTSIVKVSAAQAAFQVEDGGPAPSGHQWMWRSNTHTPLSGTIGLLTHGQTYYVKFE